jgi:FkbM family methyltransferase
MACFARELVGREGIVEVRHPLVGSVRLRLRTSDVSVAGKILLEREYDLPLRAEPAVVLDVGAYIGISTLWFAARYPGARVIALEPDPANATILRQNVRGIDRVDVLGEALWCADEPVQLAVREGAHWATRVESAHGGRPTVPGTTITTLLERLGLSEIDLLKLDVEGSEVEIFGADAERWLPRVRAIAVEVHEGLRPGARSVVLSACRDYDVLELGHETVFLERVSVQ